MGSRLVGGPRVQPEDKQKTVGPIRPTVRGVCEGGIAAVSYLEVGTDLPPPSAPKGATSRRVSSIVLFIRSTSVTTSQRRGAGDGSLVAASRKCQFGPR